MGKQSVTYKACLCLIALSSLVVAGCPDNGGTQAATGTSGAVSASGASGTVATTSGVKPGGTTAGDTPGATGTAAFITILKVVRSNIDPNSLLELIGQNGDIGNNCQTVDACECVFSWSEASGVLRTSPSALLRRESNLARCSFLNVSPDAKLFDVTLHIKAANLVSNTVRVFMPVTNPSLDSSIGSNFLPIQRYMCRDIITKQKTQLYSAGLFDPQFWDRSYAYTFYTNSIGQDYGAVAFQAPGAAAATQVPGYECPPIPNDPSDNPIYDYNIYSLGDINIAKPNDLTVLDGAGDNTIFPVTDNKNLNSGCATGSEPTCEKFAANRHDFYLSTFKSAVFHNSVCVIHKVFNIAGPSPVIDCTGVDNASGTVTLSSPAIAGKDVIGWAAVPDQNERCPDPNSVKIPAGKKWAKLWRFRTTYAQRSVQDVSNFSDIGDLYCTTREDSCQNNRQGVAFGTAAGAPFAPPGTPLPGMGPAGKNTETWVPTTEIVSTVCYNTRAPTGLGLPFQQTASIGTGLATDPGYGNCDMNANYGDGNGPGQASVGHGCQDGDYPVTNIANGGGASAGDCSRGTCLSDPAAGAPQFNCCMDQGLTLPTYEPTHRPANLTWGGQFCNPSLIGDNDASSADFLGRVGAHIHGGYDNGSISAIPGGNIVRGVAEDVWVMGNAGRHACIEADTDQGGQLASRFQVFPPVKANPFVMVPKKIDTTAKADIIYVVSPEAITVDQMQDSENGVIARQYTPYRKVTNGDGSTRQVYQLEAGSSNVGNPPANRLSQFPLCVLQDKVQGLLQGDPP